MSSEEKSLRRKDVLVNVVIALLAALSAIGGYGAVMGFSTPGARFASIEQRQEKMEATVGDHEKRVAVVEEDVAYLKSGVDELLGYARAAHGRKK
jgi:hypothetical protein